MADKALDLHIWYRPGEGKFVYVFKLVDTTAGSCRRDELELNMPASSKSDLGAMRMFSGSVALAG